MIRINLLPVKKAKKRGASQQQLILFVLIIVGLGFVLFYMKSNEDAVVAQLETRKAEIQQEMTRLEELIGDINKFQEDKKALQKKLDIITMLKKGKTGPVRVLDELSTVIPKKVWLTSLVQGGNRLTFEGYATDNREIAVFMKNLDASKYFSNVNLVNIIQEDVSGAPIPMMKFSMHCTYSLPQS